MNKRKILIWSSAVAVLSGVGYVIYSKFRNKKEIADIHNALDNRAGAFGNMDDYADIFSGKGYISRVESKVNNVIYLKDDYVTTFRKSLGDAIRGSGTDEEAIKAVFRKLKDKVQIAQVAESYQKNYEENLLDALKDDMDVDSDEMKEIYDIILIKPAYRVAK